MEDGYRFYDYIENNTNALNFTANGTSSGEIATSSDIKNLLDVGFNKFTIHTSDSVPSVSADDNLNQKLGAYTGYCYAVVNIIGFKKWYNINKEDKLWLK